MAQLVSPEQPNGEQLEQHGHPHSGATDSNPVGILDRHQVAHTAQVHGSRAADKTASGYSTSDYIDLGFGSLDFANRGRPGRNSTDSVFTSDVGPGEWRMGAGYCTNAENADILCNNYNHSTPATIPVTAVQHTAQQTLLWLHGSEMYPHAAETVSETTCREDILLRLGLGEFLNIYIYIPSCRFMFTLYLPCIINFIHTVLRNMNQVHIHRVNNNMANSC